MKKIAAILLSLLIILNTGTFYAAVQADTSVKIKFADPALEKAVRLQIKKTTGDLTKNDLLGIRRLSVDSSTNTKGKIKNLQRIENLSNLESLTLAENEITDITCLKKLTALVWLDLSGNYISDISPLSGLTKLQQLFLSNNRLKDITPLGSLKKLEQLYLYQNFIADISPLQNCPALTTLSANDNYIKNIQSLKNLKKLSYLSLSGNIISDFSPVKEMPALTSINLFDNPVKDMTPVYTKKLKNASSLDFKKTEEVGKIAHNIIKTIIKNGMTDLEKEQAIYQYIIDHTEYDYKFYKTNVATKDCPGNVYGLLVHGYAVCDGYARTMKLLGQMAGLDRLYIVGQVGREGHAWNMIKLDNSYFHLDATWDDGGKNLPSNYSFFNVSDHDMMNYGMRTWDQHRYPLARYYSKLYLNYCSKQHIPVDKPKEISGTIYLDEVTSINVTFQLIVEVFDSTSQSLYKDTFMNLMIPKGEKEYKFNVILPGDSRMAEYEISYCLFDRNLLVRYNIEGRYINDTLATTEEKSTRVPINKQVKLRISSVYGDYSGYDPDPDDYEINYKDPSPLGKDMPYLITNVNDVVLPPYSALVYMSTFLEENVVNNLVDVSSNVLATNHSTQPATLSAETILRSNPGIQGGMNTYVRLIVFSKDFEEQDVNAGFLSSSKDILYGGKWICIGQVPKAPASTGNPLGNAWIKDLTTSSFQSANMANYGMALEKDGYYYTCDKSVNGYEISYNLVKIKAADGSKTVLDPGTAADMLQILGDYLYYRGDMSNIYRIKLSTGAKEKVIEGSQFEGGINGWLYLTREGIYYISSMGFKLYKMNPTTLKSEALAENEFQDVNLIGQSIYYVNSSDHSRIYCYNLATGTNQKVSDMVSCHTLITDGNHFYFNSQDPATYEQGIYRLNVDGSNAVKLLGNYYSTINVDNGMIYGVRMGEGVFKLDKNGVETQISERKFVSSIIIGETSVYLVGPSFEFTDRIPK